MLLLIAYLNPSRTVSTGGSGAKQDTDGQLQDKIISLEYGCKDCDRGLYFIAFTCCGEEPQPGINSP